MARLTRLDWTVGGAAGQMKEKRRAGRTTPEEEQNILSLWPICTGWCTVNRNYKDEPRTSWENSHCSHRCEEGKQICESKHGGRMIRSATSVTVKNINDRDCAVNYRPLVDDGDMARRKKGVQSCRSTSSCRRCRCILPIEGT